MNLTEAIAAYGAEGRSDADLLTALGIPAESLEQVMLGAFVLLNAEDRAKAEALAELVRRAGRTGGSRPLVTSPRMAGAYLLPLCQGLTEERFGILALDAKGGIMAERIITRGTASACLISPREFFREAIRLGATSALAWHNHPSGNPEPSREDIALTRRLRAAGEALGVPLADHLVIGRDSWHSFRTAEGWDSL